jgi:sphinganine-1-phosphate aldolase
VAVVKANPALAQEGAAATYGMMSHVPLRGMIRTRVRDLFANLYSARGGEMNLEAPAAPARKLDALLEKAARWYVRRKQRAGG